MKRFAFPLCVAALVAFFAFHFVYAVQPAFAQGSAVVDAGAVPSDAGAGSPSSQLHDPIAAPGAAFDDLKAARKTSWPLAVLAGAIMLLRTAAALAKKYAWLGFLAKGKTAFGVAAGATVLAAGFDVLALGGSWVSVLTAAGAALFALLVPTSAPKADA